MPNQEDLKTVTSILKKIPLFEELNEQDHLEIIKQITLEYFPKDHVIFKEGDQGDAMYIIKRGMVNIFHEGAVDSENKNVTVLSDNDFFGEMALIEEKPRNATTKTIEESEIFKLNKEDFKKLISENPSMAAKISSEFLKRFKVNLASN